MPRFCPGTPEPTRPGPVALRSACLRGPGSGRASAPARTGLQRSLGARRGHAARTGDGRGAKLRVLWVDGENHPIAAAKDLREVALPRLGRDDLVGARQRGMHGVRVLVGTLRKIRGEKNYLLVTQVGIREPPPAPAIVERIG